MTLNDFKDIHTHNLNASDEAIINLPWGMPVPEHGFYSVGIHPWDTVHTTNQDLERLSQIAEGPRIVAIGEAGLDALRGADLSRQEEIFKYHVAISERTKKPLIIHSVRTLQHILRLRRELQPTQQWVIHGFRGKPATALQLIAQGIDISLGKKCNPGVPDCIDASHIYHETDEDY